METQMKQFVEQLRNPGYFRENRMDAHSDHVVYAPGDTISDSAAGSSFRLMLNGTWKFYYSPDFENCPEGFQAEEYDISGWDDINVPGHIQLQGYDIPQYVNVQYPWDGREELDSGKLPVEFNPAASYVKEFELPEHFSGKRVFISFQGAESALRVWLNGQYIGFASDSFTPSEFELTEYIRKGVNRLAVQVYKWNSGSWLEDQDFFRFSGLYRDVYLFAVPEHHVWDVKVSADISPDNLSVGKISVALSYISEGADYKAELFAPDGKLLDTKVLPVSSHSAVPENTAKETVKADGQKKNGGLFGKFLKNSEKKSEVPEKKAADSSAIAAYSNKKTPENPAAGTVCADFTVSDPYLWSAENPSLYSLKVTVTDPVKGEEEWFVQKTGIRHFEIKDHIMELNGRRIVIKGVNRHEFSTDSGRVVSRDDLLKDLYTMKRHNINAIRLCHYPNSSAIYELADELGFYLIDECNMESHGTWDPVERGVKKRDYVLPGTHTEYRDMLLDRIHSMVMRDKNHPSILIWSCGNESFGGPVIHAMSQELKKLDPSRLVHYEGIFHDRSFPETSDIESQMYTPVSGIKEFLSKRRNKPFICCEYSHAMGNSCGALFKYTDLTDEDPLYQGGFIWDYIDQAIHKKDRYGREYFAYGGDMGDRPNDGNFSGDGLADGNRNPTSKMDEVKYCYQNIEIQVNKDSFTVINKNLFTNTDKYQCIAILLKNGHEIQQAEVAAAVEPLGRSDYQMPFEIPDDGNEYTVTISFRLRTDEVWAKAGHETAFGQGVFTADGNHISWLENEICCNNEDAPDRKLRIIHGVYNIGAKGRDFEILFSRLYGGLVSYKYKGRELLSGRVLPNFWRAPTDNDNGNMMAFRCSQWKTASLYLDNRNPNDWTAAYKFMNPVVEESEGLLRVIYTYYLPTVPVHECRLSYEVDGMGTVRMCLEYEPPKDGWLPELPEFSVMLKMDADYDQMEWYGKGPQDCYADRNKGAKLGIYRSNAAESQENYLVPQESGSHTDVRWLKVTDKDGSGLMFDCGGLAASVCPYSPHEVESALHPTELPPVHYTYIRIGQQMGSGGDDSWGSNVHEEFLLPADRPRKITVALRGYESPDID